MSFSNDEEGDGLAALFGGINPAASTGEPGPRRAAQAAAPPETQPAPPAGQAPAPSPYPSPSRPQGPPPPSTPAYGPPVSAPPASHRFEMPAPAPEAPPSYDLPPPAAAPSAPPSAPQFGAPPPSQGYGAPPTFGAPTYAPPAWNDPSAASNPPGYPSPPAPQDPPQWAPHAAPVPAGSAYPPTTQYPPTIQYPLTTQYPAAPQHPAAPQYSPPSYAAPTPSFEAYAPPVTAPEPFREAPPGEPAAGEHPLVRSEPPAPASVFPPGPLLPSSTAAVETPDDLERSTLLEKVGLVLAVITGPIGLGLAIVNAVLSARRRGWVLGIVRASLVLGVLSSIAAGIAGYVMWNMRLDQIAHAELAAASAEFCAAADADPSMVTPPTLGWPAQGASVAESLTLMQAWTDRWTTLAASSPAQLRTGVELLAETGQTIVDSVTTARAVDDAANQAQVASAVGQSGVAEWHTTYCVVP